MTLPQTRQRDLRANLTPARDGEGSATHATFHHCRQLGGHPDGERKAQRYLLISVAMPGPGRPVPLQFLVHSPGVKLP